VEELINKAIVNDNVANIFRTVYKHYNKYINTEIKEGVSCAAHILQLGTKEGSNESTIDKTCFYCQKIVSFFHHSNKASSTFKE